MVELGALTFAGTDVSYVKVPDVALLPAGNVTDPEMKLRIAGSVTDDEVAENVTACELETGGWGVMLTLPPPPHPANAKQADAKRRRLFNVRSRRTRAISATARLRRACRGSRDML
jgi:hypothetical protein